MTAPKKRRAKWWIAAALAAGATTGTIIATQAPSPTFEDNFDGTTLDTAKWTVQRSATSGAKPDIACWDNYPETIHVSAGTLKLRNVKVPEFTCQSPYGDFQARYKGASISTRNHHEFTYGKVEVRAKFPTARVPGIHSAIWLYPRTTTYGPWPKSGEIDIAEYYTRYPDRAIPTLHYDTTPSPTALRCLIKTPADWHTYTLNWRPDGITISYDDQVCLTHTVGKPFDQPFYLLLTQTLGIGQNPFTEGKTPLPQTMEVDRVRIWKDAS
jgi:beta-glucanase (GH16 family)